MPLRDREEIIASLLELSKNGVTKAQMGSALSVSPTQLRKILAELVDKGFLFFSFNGESAWRSVDERWAKENSEWVGSNYIEAYCCNPRLGR